MEQAFGFRHGLQSAHLATTAGLPKNRHTTGIAAKRPYVIAYPFERRDQIQHSGIARLRVFGAADLREVQEAECVDAVIHAHDHHVMLARQFRAVV